MATGTHAYTMHAGVAEQILKGLGFSDTDAYTLVAGAAAADDGKTHEYIGGRKVRVEYGAGQRDIYS